MVNPAENFTEGNDLRPIMPNTGMSAKRLSLWLKCACILFLCSAICAIYLASKLDSTGIGERGISVKAAAGNKDGIGVVRVYGVISQSMRNYDFEKIGSSALAGRIRKMGKKKNVKGIVLDINSPGGTVGAVQEIYDAILYVRLKEKKPVIAIFGDIAASGGYYIASACNEIYAHAGTMTGSIGVIMSGSNFEGLMQKIGLKSEVIKSGKYKDIGSPYREMTAEERKLLQAMIDDSYEQFIAAIAKGRNMPKEQVIKLADGRIYTGRQALSAKLIDKLGNYQDALNRAGELSGLGKDPEVIHSSGDSFETFLSIISSKFGGDMLSKAMDNSIPKLEYRLYMR